MLEMKVYTELEILKFMEKMKNSIVADNILLQLEDPRKNPQEFQSFIDALDKSHSLGIKQGNIQGRLDLLNDMIKHFDI
jgi:hypothetical protein